MLQFRDKNTGLTNLRGCLGAIGGEGDSNDKGDTKVTLQREVKEETGITIDKNSLYLIKSTPTVDWYGIKYTNCPKIVGSDQISKNEVRQPSPKEKNVISDNGKEPFNCKAPFGHLWSPMKNIKDIIKKWKSNNKSHTKNLMMGGLENMINKAEQYSGIPPTGPPDPADPADAAADAVEPADPATADAVEPADPATADAVDPPRPEKTKRITKLLKKLNDYTDYCKELNSAYEEKHQEVETLVNYLDYIFNNMPELPTGHKIVYEIIYTLEGMEDLKIDLDLPTKKAQQKAWLQQARNNKERIRHLINEYNNNRNNNSYVFPEESDANSMPNNEPLSDYEDNNKNVNDISPHNVRRLYQNVPITKDTVRTAIINNPDFILKYCRIEKIKFNIQAQLMKCYTNFFGELYKNVIKIMEIALTDEKLVKGINYLVKQYFIRTAKAKGKRDTYYIKNYYNFLDKQVMKYIKQDKFSEDEKKEINFFYYYLPNLLENTEPNNEEYVLRPIRSDINVDTFMDILSIPKWLK